MGVDYSRAGVSRGRTPDETAPKATTDLTWYAARRDLPRARPTTAAGPVSFVLEGASGSSGLTSLTLMHGGEALETDSPGIPTSTTITPDSVAVSFLASNVPAGDWTLTLQARDLSAGETNFRDVATFDFATS